MAMGLSGARSATLEPMSGIVSLNTGDGYKPIVWPLAVQPGDDIKVGPGSSALIIYSDVCSIKVEPDSLYVVSGESPCEPAKNAQAAVETNPYLVVGAITAGAVGVGLAVSHHSAHPASP